MLALFENLRNPAFRPPRPTDRKFLSTVTPTGHERHFHADEVIVSKTDLQGRITYANETFLKIADMTEAEAIGAAHSIIRHPDMPRAIFKFLWQTLENGDEVFAYVVNLAANGDHYWVFAHVTPSFDGSGNIIGYHSNRRVPEPQAVQKIIPVYQKLLRIEQGNASRKEGLKQSMKALAGMLEESGQRYDEFIFSV